MLASLILPYDISFQATGNYRARSLVSQGYRKSNASLDLGLRKSFYNKMFALSINWRDVLGTRKWETYTSTDALSRHSKDWRDPRINVTLTWNFGNMNSKKKQRQEEQGMDDEQQNFGGYE